MTKCQPIPYIGWQLKEPLGTDDAKRLILEILEHGSIRPTQHWKERIGDHDLVSGDCLRVLRGGYVEGMDLVDGTWRYRVVMGDVCVVIAFRSQKSLAMVTAWRF